MVKKRLKSGEACRKCIQAEDLLRRRGHWDSIDEIVWAEEGEEDSPGMLLAKEHEVEVAPFYLVRDDSGTTEVFESALKLIRAHLKSSENKSQGKVPAFDLEKSQAAMAKAHPQQAVRLALEEFGSDCVIAFSGAEDVVLIDLAVQTGLPFSVMVVDTGRLHSETYRFVEKVRTHYGIEMLITAPRAESLEPFVRKKGLFSFFEDGHKECCSIRKVEPLRAALKGYRAWMTGQRKDQSPTRTELDMVQIDDAFVGREGELVKFNPLANWSRDLLWQFIRDHKIPYNPLHEQGFSSIGCEPCTRPVLPGQHEREGRWWWEEATQKECGLHRKG